MEEITVFFMLFFSLQGTEEWRPNNAVQFETKQECQIIGSSLLTSPVISRIKCVKTVEI